jgi:hypothetical protein
LGLQGRHLLLLLLLPVQLVMLRLAVAVAAAVMLEVWVLGSRLQWSTEWWQTGHR